MHGLFGAGFEALCLRNNDTADLVFFILLLFVMVLRYGWFGFDTEFLLFD